MKSKDTNSTHHASSTDHDLRLIVLGVITAPHGIRGQVKIRSFTANPEDLTAYGPLTSKSGAVFEVKITSHTKDVLIADIKGVNSRDDAEKLRGIELCVPRSALPDSDENEYYHEDLVGLKVQTQSGEPYGIIEAVHNFGAGDLVSLKLISGKEELLPFTKASFPNIDIKKGIAVIEPPVFVEGEAND